MTSFDMPWLLFAWCCALALAYPLAPGIGLKAPSIEFGVGLPNKLCLAGLTADSTPVEGQLEKRAVKGV